MDVLSYRFQLTFTITLNSVGLVSGMMFSDDSITQVCPEDRKNITVQNFHTVAKLFVSRLTQIFLRRNNYTVTCIRIIDLKVSNSSLNQNSWHVFAGLYFDECNIVKKKRTTDIEFCKSKTSTYMH